jgi:hypothetical protein
VPPVPLAAGPQAPVRLTGQPWGLALCWGSLVLRPGPVVMQARVPALRREPASA